jgi:ribosomal protein S18 acetylase RimI-like enzyme
MKLVRYGPAGLPAELFTDPVWHALNTRHSHLALIAGDARRYPVDVAPFAALAKPTERALWELHSLLAPGEFVWLMGTAYPYLPELTNEGTLECAQMVLNAVLEEKPAPLRFERLTSVDSGAMVVLTDIAFPGFFRSRTYEMGTYYGAWLDGQLIAMAGERLALDGYTEISGVCTHPGHRGKGLAARLVARVARDHREQGVVSFLHVGAANTHAIDLYRRLGFVEARRITLTRLSRAAVE